MSYMKDSFEKWINSAVNNNGNPYSKETISNYITSLKNHASKLTDIHLSSTDLFFIDNQNDFDEIFSTIKKSSDYNKINELYHRIFSSALSVYQKFLLEIQTTNDEIIANPRFEEWMKSYPNHKYTDSTIKRYIRALQKAEEWLSITLSHQVLNVNTLSEFLIIEQQIRSSKNFASINQDHGHGDLSAALAAYQKFLEELDHAKMYHSIGTFDSWEIVDENTAIKTCDKSFFEYNGSGIPKDICWYFDADNLPQGETRQIVIEFEGNKYTGRISNESSDRRRTRIFWGSDLGQKFNSLRNDTEQRLRFDKKDDKYIVCFERGEQKGDYPKNCVNLLSGVE